MWRLRSIQNRRCRRCMPGTNVETGDRKECLGKQLFYVFEALRFFPATLASACFLVRDAFLRRDSFNSFSIVRTRESGIPKVSATFSAETMLSRIRAGLRIFKSYNRLYAHAHSKLSNSGPTREASRENQ